jgi:hypothetical protein
MGLDGIGKATGRAARNINGSLFQGVAFFKALREKNFFCLSLPANQL